MQQAEDAFDLLPTDSVQAVLPMARLRCHAVAVGPIRVRPRLGTDLRGAIGWHLRFGHCPEPYQNPCGHCSDAAPCAYRLGFEAAGPPEHLPGGGHQDWPRPLWLRVLGPERVVQPGGFFAFELLAVGAMCAHLPDVVAALMRVQTSGLGREHAWFRLATVQSLAPDGAVLADTEHLGLVRTRVPVEVVDVCVPTLSEPVARTHRLTLSFDAPVRLRSSGSTKGPPSLDALLGALGRRTRLLAERWGQPFERVRWPDATGAEIVEQRGQCLEWDRTSGTQGGKRYAMGGYVGTVTYQGQVAHVLDWLQLGELLHVGSDIPFGLGQYRIVDCR